MKKTLLLTSLVASMVAMAGTTGSVKSFAESEAKFETRKSVSETDLKKIETEIMKSYKVEKIGVETEVKVKESGLSFGGIFQAKDLKLGEVKKVNYLNHSSVWAKYELPELSGVKTYVKATLSPKFASEKQGEEDNYKFNGSAELEGQVSYKYDALTFGLNSKTNFPFVKSENNVDNYGKDVKSTHKLFVESEKDKDVFVKGLKDVKASLEIKHNYAKEVTKAGDRVDYVKGNVELACDSIKDLRIDGKADFTVNVNGLKKIGNTKLGDYNLEDIELVGTLSKVPVDFVHTYNAKLTYTGVKGLTLSVAPFISHSQIKNGPIENDYIYTDNEISKFDNVIYGASLNAQYKMLNNQLTLTGKALLAGDSVLKNGANKKNLGVFVFDANAKYDYIVTDKFTVSPEANANLYLFVSKQTPADKLDTEPTLTLTPKVSAEYKPTDTLTLKGSVEVPVKFGIVTKSFKKDSDGKYNNGYPIEGFGYYSTSIKTSLNLKYEWK